MLSPDGWWALASRHPMTHLVSLSVPAPLAGSGARRSTETTASSIENRWMGGKATWRADFLD